VTKTTLFDNTDMMMVMASRPLPPKKLRWDGKELVWDSPKHNAEIRGYVVYGAKSSGGPYQPLTRGPIAKTRRPSSPDMRYYVVTSVEQCGEESPYSAEIAVGGAPLKLFVEAEQLTMESPVVERRAPGSSSSHFVAQDPYMRQKLKRDGGLTWKIERAPGSPMTFWARVRSVRKGKSGTAEVMLGGKSLGRVTASAGTWTWERLRRKVSVAASKHGPASVTLVPKDAAFAVDMLALFSDPKDKPAGHGNADQASPASPKDLRAEVVGDREIFLYWTASAERDLSHYNVYASIDGKVAAKQRHLVGSPHQPKLVDWGLKTGATYSYLVTAVDRAGNESKPGASASASTPKRDETVIRLEAESAQRSETGKGPSGMFAAKDERCSGGGFVGCRVPGDKKTKFADRFKLPSKKTNLSWRIRVDKPGEYMVWLRLRSHKRAAMFQFTLDRGKPIRQSIRFGWWDARTQNLIWGDLSRAYCWFWTDVPKYRHADTRAVRVKLSQGEHTFEVGAIRPGVDVDAVVLTSDFSWIPKGTINYF